jgi:uncharacterized protein (DUF1778 family)
VVGAFDFGVLALYGRLPYILGSGARMRSLAKGKRKQERKTERLELRVAPSVRSMIERATAVSGLAAGDLAYEGARRVLEEHERMVLRGADAEAFLRAVASPSPPSDRLVAALRKRASLHG